jgi:hypothetical protein
MPGVLGSIARIMKSGSATMDEIAELTGITREQLADRLALMERQEYIARQPDAADPECSCGSCCASCSSRDGGQKPVLYTLTVKGECLAALSGKIP